METKRLSRTIERTVLENGTRIISSYRRGDIIACGFGFDHGAIYDPPEYDGLSHGVEHFMLKGAPGYPYRTATRILEECGTFTAQTSKFRILVPMIVTRRRNNEDFRRAFRVLSKLISQPTFSELDFELEKEAITREIEETETCPSWQAYQFLYETLFTAGSPLARTIIGNAEIIRKITRETLTSYYASLFSPERIILVSHGALKHQSLVRAATAFFKRWEDYTKKISAQTEFRFKYKEVDRKLQLFSANPKILRPQPRVSEKIPEEIGGIGIGCKAPCYKSPYRYALKIIECIVGGHMIEGRRSYSGDLFYFGRERRGLFYHPDEIRYEPSPQNGCFYIRLETKASLLEAAEEVILEMFSRYRKDGIKRETIESAKEKIESSFRILRSCGVETILDMLLESEIGGDPSELSGFIPRIRAVTRKKVMEAIERFFDPERHIARCLIYPAQKQNTTSP